MSHDNSATVLRRAEEAMCAAQATVTVHDDDDDPSGSRGFVAKRSLGEPARVYRL